MEVVSIIHGLHNNAQHKIRKKYNKNSDHISGQNALKSIPLLMAHVHNEN